MVIGTWNVPNSRSERMELTSTALLSHVNHAGSAKEMEELEDKLSEMEQPCSSLINTTPCKTTASLGNRSKNTKGNHSKKK